MTAYFDTEERLYHLEGEGELGELLVETFSLREHLNRPWDLQLSALSLRSDIDTAALLGQGATLRTTLSDGSPSRRSGVVMAAQALDADGGFARYRLHLAPWLALLAHTRRSQVWQERSLVQIIDSVFADYAGLAAWRWAEDVQPHLAASTFSDTAGRRSYCVQYRETDLAFVQRLLAEEGLGLRFEADAQAPLGHTAVIFADSAQAASCPEDAASASGLGGRGIRFHRDAAVEEQDTIQAFGGQRSLRSTVVTTLGYDYKARRSVAAQRSTALAFAGRHADELAPLLESYQHAGAYAHGDAVRAARAALLMQQTLEARHKTWLGRGTVRSFSVGLRFGLAQSTLDDLLALGVAQDELDRQFLLTELTHAGINNLPKELSARLAQRGERAEAQLADWVPDTLREQAARSGYANAFSALRVRVPWRPWLWDDSGALLNPRPTAQGLQTATVVGPEGQTEARGADEIHTDRLGRVRIRFPWQGGSTASSGTSVSSSWVRVLQRWAGGGHGQQFVPRIGQEVLVGFLDDDIDRPVVQGALYNGRGEAGLAPTPGGRPATDDTQALAASHDHAPSAQGNLRAGNSPAWHGAAPGDASPGARAQNHAAAMSGVKTQEFGGSGSNQLVFDDSDQQLRVQLATTQHASQLNLGHLLHQADNHRGGFRGLGFELRTDAWGALRAARGVLLSSYAQPEVTPAGDNTAGLALSRQLLTLCSVLSGAAQSHRTTQLAAQLGSIKPATAALSPREAPMPALHTVLKGMVSETGPEAAAADAARQNTAPAIDRLPQFTDPVVALSARAGLGVVAGQDLQLTAGETLTLAAGQDLQFAIGGAARIHTGQSIGLLGGAMQPGSTAAGKGLTVIAGQGDVQWQAQSDRIDIAAKRDITVQSQSRHVDWAAAKKIVLATAGGANITIAGGDITVTCPGKISVWAGKKSFLGPQQVSHPLPVMPSSTPRPVSFALSLQDIPGASGAVPVGQPWHIVVADVRSGAGGAGGVPPEVFNRDHWTEVLCSGSVGGSGRIPLTQAQQDLLNQRATLQAGRVWLVSGLTAMALQPARWTGRTEDVIPEKIVDALNFAGDGRGLAEERRDWLAEHARSDAGVPGLAALKPRTDA